MARIPTLRSGTTLSVVALVCLVLTSCADERAAGPDDGPTASAAPLTPATSPSTAPPTSASPTAPSPSPSTSEAADEARAIAEAETVLRDYFDVWSTLRAADSDRELSQLKALTIEPVTTEESDRLEEIWGSNSYGVGKVAVEEANAVSIDQGGQTEDGFIPPSIEFETCVDRSGYDFLDANGQSRSKSTTPSRTLWRVIVINLMPWGDPTADWRIAYAQAIIDESDTGARVRPC